MALQKFLVEVDVNDCKGVFEIYAQDAEGAEMIISSMFSHGYDRRADEYFRKNYGHSAPITNIKRI